VLAGSQSIDVAADVKCYYCGHVSGQIIGRRNQPLRLSAFVPRVGYTGPEIKPGVRLRCERCSGPVFLEDAAPVIAPRSEFIDLREERPAAKRMRKAA
jgi:hypothetical protein